MSYILSTSFSSAKPSPTSWLPSNQENPSFVSLGYRNSYAWLSHFILYSRKNSLAILNSINFTPNELNGFTVDEFGNHLSMSENSMRFWKSHIVLYDKGAKEPFILYANVLDNTKERKHAERIPNKNSAAFREPQQTSSMRAYG